ncbi:MAG: J domain-containing protein [Bryobacterales bacterium]|nr:J domain-containing protein [Bryobacterales bacterium]MDE0629572.1 J domain-containing protein [Bryobacterales bacterium]
MFSPLAVLGLPSNCTDKDVRKRYLELVVAHPPGKDPEAFQRIQEAYEAVRTLEGRIDWELFGATRQDSFEEALSEVERLCKEDGWKPPGLKDLVRADWLGESGT